MSILVWFRDKLFGKPRVETPVNPQITDAVTQSAPVVAVVTTTTKKPKKSTAPKAKKTK